MIKKDWNTLEKYIRSLANELGLKDWSIDLKRDKYCAAGFAATVNTIVGQKTAIIHVTENFRELSVDLCSKTMMHELIHIHLQPMYNWALTEFMDCAASSQMETLRRTFDLMEEFAVDGLSVAIYDKFPKLAW